MAQGHMSKRGQREKAATAYPVRMHAVARAPLEYQAQAVARVEAGEGQRRVAADLGVSHTTVGRWIDGARRAETDHQKKVASTAMEIAASIKKREAEARLALLDRLVSVASDCGDNVQQIATAYGILTDKANVARGRPSSIFGRSPDERDAEIERLLEEEMARRSESWSEGEG